MVQLGAATDPSALGNEAGGGSPESRSMSNSIVASRSRWRINRDRSSWQTRAADVMPTPGSIDSPSRAALHGCDDGGVGLAPGLAHGLEAVLDPVAPHVVDQGRHQ